METDIQRMRPLIVSYVSFGYKMLYEKEDDDEDIANLRRAMEEYAKQVEDQEGSYEVYFFLPRIHIVTSTSAFDPSNYDAMPVRATSKSLSEVADELVNVKNGKPPRRSEIICENITTVLFLLMLPLFMVCTDELVFYQTLPYMYDSWARAERMTGYVLNSGVSFQRLRVPEDPPPTFESVIGDLYGCFEVGHKLPLASWTYDIFQNELFMLITDPRNGTVRADPDIISLLCENSREWPHVLDGVHPRQKPRLVIGESAMHVELN